MKLTDLSVRALSVESGQRVFFDESLKGFGVRVSPKSKTFVLIIHKGNRNRWETLGRYPLVSLSKAREAARDRLAGIQLGINPIEDPIAFQDAVEQFYDTHCRTMRTGKETKRIINKHFLPRFRFRPLAGIPTREIASILDGMAETPAEARSAYTRVSGFFSWAAQRGYIETSPLSRLKAPRMNEPRSRVLSDAELVSVWKAPQGQYGAIVKLAILTGQRLGQIKNLRAEFIDPEEQLIIWPAALMKTGKAHTVPYGPMIGAILDSYPKQGLLFPTRKGGAFNTWTRNKLRINAASGVTDWTHHDLRRTFATKLAELGIAPHIIERLLAHSGGTIRGVAAIYNRASYLPEMRSAMQVFEARLQSLLSNKESTNGRDLRELHRAGSRAA